MAPGSPTTEATVPESAARIADLLNSRAYSALTDRLTDADTAAPVLARFGQRAGEPVPPERLELARTVRQDLLDTLFATEPADALRAWAAFTDHTAQISYQQDFTTGTQPALRQVAGDPVIGTIALCVAELVTQDNWTRLRSCANSECGEFFYDTTRSRTRRWHSYEICGNRTNVAAYRARAKHPA